MGWVAGATHPSIATNQPAKQAKNQEQTNNCSWEKKIFWLPATKQGTRRFIEKLGF